MRVILAMLRSSWLTATSYRLGFLFSLGSLAAGVVPIAFISKALQPVAQKAIAGEGGQFFSFVLVGMVALWFVVAAINALPNAISSTLAGGTLDTYLGTPTPPAVIFIGLTAYDFTQTLLRGVLALAVGGLLGAHILWWRVLLGVPIIALIVLSYIPLAIMVSAMVVAFRTEGPTRTGLVLVSTLLGGVYWPTKVIPSWIQTVSQFVPLTYGLRALRRVMLEGVGYAAVSRDLLTLLGMTAVLALLAWVAITQAFRYARRVGTLAYY